MIKLSLRMTWWWKLLTNGNHMKIRIDYKSCMLQHCNFSSRRFLNEEIKFDLWFSSWNGWNYEQQRKHHIAFCRAGFIECTSDQKIVHCGLTINRDWYIDSLILKSRLVSMQYDDFLQHNESIMMVVNWRSLQNSQTFTCSLCSLLWVVLVNRTELYETSSSEKIRCFLLSCFILQ